MMSEESLSDSIKLIKLANSHLDSCKAKNCHIRRLVQEWKQ